MVAMLFLQKSLHIKYYLKMSETIIDNNLTKLASTVVDISTRSYHGDRDADFRKSNVATVIRYEVIELLRMIANIKKTSLPGSDKEDRIKQLAVQYGIDATIIRDILQ